MNRFSILIALVAFVGLAGATFHHKGGLKHHGIRRHHQQHFQDGEDFGDVDSHHGGRFQGFQDEEEFGFGQSQGLRHGQDVEGGFNRNSGFGQSQGLRHGQDVEGGFNRNSGLGQSQGLRHGQDVEGGFNRNSGLGQSHGLRHGQDVEGGFNRNSGLGQSQGLRHGQDVEGGFNRNSGLGHRHSDRFGLPSSFSGNRHGGKLSHGGQLRRGGLNNGINRHSGVGSGFEQGSIGGGSNRLAHRRRHGSSSGGLGAHGAGIVGGHRRQNEFEAGLGGSNHGESNFGVEGHQGAQISGEQHFNNAHNRGENDDTEGVHKHQVINKDKTFFQDKSNGVNDVDGFRHSTGSHDDRHSELGTSGSASENSGVSLNRQNEFDNEFGAGLEGDSSSETVLAHGIGRAVAVGSN